MSMHTGATFTPEPGQVIRIPRFDYKPSRLINVEVISTDRSPGGTLIVRGRRITKDTSKHGRANGWTTVHRPATYWVQNDTPIDIVEG